MLKKKLGFEAIEKDWAFDYTFYYYKIPSTLIIPEGCEKIGRYAFNSCWWLKKVEISESVDWIGRCAFPGYEIEIIIRKPMSEFRHIGDCAFGFCKNVKEEIGG